VCTPKQPALLFPAAINSDLPPFERNSHSYKSSRGFSMARNNPNVPLCTGPVIRLTVEMTNPVGQRFQIILDYMAATPIGVTQTVMTAFLTGWQTNCQTALRAVLGADVTITRYMTAEIETGTCPTVVTNVSFAGTEASDSLPGTVAAVTTKYSAWKGQHGRGRIYYGGVPITFTDPTVDPNRLLGAAVTAYAAVNTALLLAVVAGGVNWNLSITTRPAPPAVLVARGTNVTILTVQQPLGTVRRRREGRGI